MTDQPKEAPLVPEEMIETYRDLIECVTSVIYQDQVSPSERVRKVLRAFATELLTEECPDCAEPPGYRWEPRHYGDKELVKCSNLLCGKHGAPKGRVVTRHRLIQQREDFGHNRALEGAAAERERIVKWLQRWMPIPGCAWSVRDLADELERGEGP